MTTLLVEASEAAPRFILRDGFDLVSRGRFDVRGVAVRYYEIQKSLHTGRSAH
jgi:hypothetical protein